MTKMFSRTGMFPLILREADFLKLNHICLCKFSGLVLFLGIILSRVASMLLASASQIYVDSVREFAPMLSIGEMQFCFVYFVV